MSDDNSSPFGWPSAEALRPWLVPKGLKLTPTERSTGELNQPAELYEAANLLRPGELVYRRPIHYAPPSSARVNLERLPPIEQMADMQLAYREQTLSTPSLIQSARTHLNTILFLTLGLAGIVAAVKTIVPLGSVPVFAGVASAMWLLVLLYTRSMTAKRALFAVIVPISLGLLILLLAALASNRLTGTLIAGAAAFGLTFRYGSILPDIAMQWVYAHPRLRPATRALRPKTRGPDFIYLAVVLGIAFAAGTISPLLAMIGIVIATWFWTDSDSGLTRRKGLAVGQVALATSLHVNSHSSLAPGIFYPRHPFVPALAQYRLLSAMTFTYAPIVLTLGFSLSAFLPDTAWYLLSNPGATVDVFNLQMLTRSPVWWVEEAFRRVSDGADAQIWTYVTALAIGAVLPPIVLLGLYWKSIEQIWEARRRVEHIEPELDDAEDLLDADNRVEWQWYVDRLKESPHSAPDPIDPTGEATIKEREHLFAGVQPHSAFPVLLDRKILAEHTYMVGDSGSGKTSLGIMPLLIQLMEQDCTEAGRVDLDRACPIVILDLKGDNALFHLARTRAEAQGREFRYFTPEKGRASHVFNPLTDLQGDGTSGPSVAQTAQLLLDSLGLNHGEGYGRSYYSRQSRRLLLKTLAEAKSPPKSIDDLTRLLEAHKGDDALRDTLELAATLYSLSLYRNVAKSTTSVSPDGVIHMPSVLERRQVVYFWLPAAVESASVREIGKLALYCLLSAAIARSRDGLEKRQSYVFIDEFQRIAAENFKVILEQARSFGLGLVLANQSLSDLRTPTIDLRSTVRTNTRYKRFFSVSDVVEMEELSKASGEEVLKLYAKSYGYTHGYTGNNRQESWSDTGSDILSIKNMLTPGDLLETSDHPLDSIVHVTRGSGYTQFGGRPLRVRCTWPMPESAYRQLATTPWPARQQWMIDQENEKRAPDEPKGAKAGSKPREPAAADAPTAPAGTVENDQSPEEIDQVAEMNFEQTLEQLRARL